MPVGGSAHILHRERVPRCEDAQQCRGQSCRVLTKSGKSAIAARRGGAGSARPPPRKAWMEVVEQLQGSCDEPVSCRYS
eukprot:scaffold22420_cov124-Isochrysis_galbana.AAC.9